MQSAAQTSDIVNTALESQRRFQRVNLALFGRYMLEDKREYPCQVEEMSTGGASIIGPKTGGVGEKVVAYLDHIGRIEGNVIRHTTRGFVMSVRATLKKRDKMAEKLTWLANRHELNLAEDRRHVRKVPHVSGAQVKLEDGRSYSVRILDLSLSGAAISSNIRPAVGTLLWLGTTRGRVVRHFDEGYAIEFAAVQTEDSLQRYLSSAE